VPIAEPTTELAVLYHSTAANSLAAHSAESAFGVTETLILVTIYDQVWIWVWRGPAGLHAGGHLPAEAVPHADRIISAARLVRVRGDAACSQAFAGHDEYPCRDAAGTPPGRMSSELGGARL
jgi:hypothetical protein